MMTDKIYNVLFLCTGNSARSIMAEAIMNAAGKGRFRAYSAGSHPSDTVNPNAIETLRVAGLSVDGMRSKSWDEFAVPGAPEMDFVFTVCDNAAGEVCPIWPGQPMTAHWGIADPAAFEGPEAETRAVFYQAFRHLQNRIGLFLNLPLASIDRLSLKSKIDAIGTTAAPEPKGN